MKRRGHRLRLVLLAVLLATGVGAILKATDALPARQLAALDTLLRRSAARRTRRPTSCIVGIDDKTLQADPRPISRSTAAATRA